MKCVFCDLTATKVLNGFTVDDWCAGLAMRIPADLKGMDWFFAVARLVSSADRRMK